MAAAKRQKLEDFPLQIGQVTKLCSKARGSRTVWNVPALRKYLRYKFYDYADEWHYMMSKSDICDFLWKHQGLHTPEEQEEMYKLEEEEMREDVEELRAQEEKLTGFDYVNGLRSFMLMQHPTEARLVLLGNDMFHHYQKPFHFEDSVVCEEETKTETKEEKREVKTKTLGDFILRVCRWIQAREWIESKNGGKCVDLFLEYSFGQPHDSRRDNPSGSLGSLLERFHLYSDSASPRYLTNQPKNLRVHMVDRRHVREHSKKKAKFKNPDEYIMRALGRLPETISYMINSGHHSFPRFTPDELQHAHSSLHNFWPRYEAELEEPPYKLKSAFFDAEKKRVIDWVMRSTLKFTEGQSVDEFHEWATNAKTYEDKILRNEELVKRYESLDEKQDLVGYTFESPLHPQVIISWLLLLLQIWRENFEELNTAHRVRPGFTGQPADIRTVTDISSATYNLLRSLFIDPYTFQRLTKTFNVATKKGRCQDTPRVNLGFVVAGLNHIATLHHWLSQQSWKTIVHLKSDVRCVFFKPIAAYVQAFLESTTRPVSSSSAKKPSKPISGRDVRLAELAKETSRAKLARKALEEEKDEDEEEQAEDEIEDEEEEEEEDVESEGDEIEEEET